MTEREREVLALPLAEGRSNPDIGEMLFVSPTTLEAHIHQIFMKLGLDETRDYDRSVLAVLTFRRS